MMVCAGKPSRRAAAAAACASELAEARGFGDGFQFGRFKLGIEASVEEHEESEAGGFDRGAVAGP
jgi:hypothetical protein